MAKRKDLEYDRWRAGRRNKADGNLYVQAALPAVQHGLLSLCRGRAVSPDYFNCAAVPEDLCGKGARLKWLSKKRLITGGKS